MGKEDQQKDPALVEPGEAEADGRSAKRLKTERTFNESEGFDFSFLTALASALFIFFSSSLSDPFTGFSYSATVAQPPGEESANLTSLFL